MSGLQHSQPCSCYGYNIPARVPIHILCLSVLLVRLLYLNKYNLIYQSFFVPRLTPAFRSTDLTHMNICTRHNFPISYTIVFDPTPSQFKPTGVELAYLPAKILAHLQFRCKWSLIYRVPPSLEERPMIHITESLPLHQFHLSIPFSCSLLVCFKSFPCFYTIEI